MPHFQDTADAILRKEEGVALTGTVLAGAALTTSVIVRLHTAALSGTSPTGTAGSKTIPSEVTGSSYVALTVAASTFSTITSATGTESISFTAEERFPVNATATPYTVAAISESLVDANGTWTHKYFNFPTPPTIGNQQFFDMASGSGGYVSSELDA